MEITVDRSVRHWWVFVLRGIGFIILAIYLLASPANGAAILGYIFGLVILFAGFGELLHAYHDKGSPTRTWHWIIGFVDVILGLILISHVGTSFDIIRIIVGVYIIFRGISIFSFRNSFGRSWWVIIGGALITLFGLIVLFNPIFGAMTIVLWTALAFLLTGTLNLLLGYRLKPKH